MASADPTPKIAGGVSRALHHDSAHKHVSGEAVYVDDMPEPPALLQVYIAYSSQAHARIETLDLSAVAAHPDCVGVYSARDIPGVNDVSPIFGDDPLFADGVVEYYGQPLFAVAAATRARARRAAAAARIEYQPLPAILTVDQALAAQSFVLEPRILVRGDPQGVLKKAGRRLKGRLRIGGQEHFYLEGQVALAIPGEDRDIQVYSSTQHPTEMQHLIAKLLGLNDNAVTVDVRRMGGAFGGKETQAAAFGAVAALVAFHTGRPAKVRLDRDDDMHITGKRHDFRADYEVGFEDDGRIVAFDLMLASRCGRSVDLSGAINDRAVFHADNCYYLEHVRIRSYRCKTHTASNTAFRGFGGPQGMMVIEHAIDRVAAELGMDPLEVRRVNLYGIGERNLTPYEMEITDNVLPRLFEELSQSAEYWARREAVREFNASHRWLKKGLALTPVKFGIAFTTTHLNQAGALVHVYGDGSVHLNHGGTEMGQGLFTKVAQVVAEEFAIDYDRVKITATSTGKVPNTSATAASSGSDLNGKAAQAAARTIKQRLIDFAAAHYHTPPDAVRFESNRVHVGERSIPFAELVRQAYLGRVPLSATGFYRTPKIGYDAKTGKGRPFLYFAYGAAVSEVCIDTLTGESRLERVDILHDAGASLNPAIDLGQIEGGFVQGMGWLTSEELYWNADGMLATHAPSTYKIPTSADRPVDFRMKLLTDNPNAEPTIYRSKAVGEPPLMLAISVFRAISDAVAAAGQTGRAPNLDAPATPERILNAIEDLRAHVPADVELRAEAEA